MQPDAAAASPSIATGIHRRRRHRHCRRRRHHHHRHRRRHQHHHHITSARHPGSNASHAPCGRGLAGPDPSPLRITWRMLGLDAVSSHLALVARERDGQRIPPPVLHLVHVVHVLAPAPPHTLSAPRRTCAPALPRRAQAPRQKRAEPAHSTQNPHSRGRGWDPLVKKTSFPHLGWRVITRSSPPFSGPGSTNENSPPV
eukprot:2834296-Rhodomonas_salina.1